MFVVALITYILTVEPTASFWDPGEFIATSAKLQVGHPPGAPLFQMMGAFFSTFAPDKTDVALLVNMISVISSALAILFLFWSVSLLIRKITGPAETLTPAKKFAILGSAGVGALAFTFTDSFWFSAVEAEVYAMAMFFMALLFYLGLLWERDMFKPRGNRWLILIAFLIGLTFGVHFLALLAIPSIGYLYYFKTVKKITVKNFIIASIVVVGVLLFIFKLLLPYSLSFFATAEIFFVNSIGLPFNSGTIIAALFLIAVFYFVLRYTRKKGYAYLNTGVLCILFILVGFSSWVMLPIRANAGTTINENSPDNARELLAYYNREQYPDNPLFYGPQFTKAFAGLDEEKPYVDDEPKYDENYKTGKYEIVNDWKNGKQNTSDKQKTFLPRMWSEETSHIKNYMNLTGPVEFNVKPEAQQNQQLVQMVNEVQNQYDNGQIDNEGLTQFLTQYGQYLDVKKPTTGANFQYMFRYQFWYMYFRYFMWNFVGRQNDEQGELTNLDGNWLSGIKPIDSIFLGSQYDLPDSVKNNPSRATYFFLPLILGLIGLFFQYDRDKRNFWVLMVLFLFTGLAISFYLNERPFEPRERDYARVGSFYVFAMWIGFGVYSLFEKLRKYLKPKLLAPILTVICLLAVPVVMAQQNWASHDRSEKYTATALAKNYLDSVEKDGILFTIGDNDTFPLWYAQEVEGYRRDVKIINTSLFATSWYINQMKRKTYESDPLKTVLDHKDYRVGTNDQIIYKEDSRMPDTMDIKQWLKYVKSDNSSTQITMQNDHSINTFPTKHINLPVDKENAIKSGIVAEKDSSKMVSNIPIKITGDQIGKNTLLMLDVIANLDWDRPVHFSGGSFDSAQYLWMKDYLELDGLTYKLVPVKTKVDKNNPYEMGRMDTDTMYKNVMNWHWGGSGNPDMYYDPQTRKNSISYRSNMARLVKQLIKEDKEDKAKDVLDLAMEKLPLGKFNYYSLVNPFVASYYKIGEQDKAQDIWNKLAIVYQQKLDYFSGLSGEEKDNMQQEIVAAIQRYRDLIDIVVQNDEEGYAKEKAKEFNSYIEKFGPEEGADQLKIDNPEKEVEEGQKDSNAAPELQAPTEDQVPN